MGAPKALASDRDGAWLPRAVDLLRAGGCAEVLVVLGAAAERAAELVPADPAVRVVAATDWAEGISSSLRAGLAAAAATEADAAMITLVDLPDLRPAVAHRLLADLGDARSILVRAVFDGRPGHPVLIGRTHWEALASDLGGDRGAGPYLRRHGARSVECGDLATGQDRDTP